MTRKIITDKQAQLARGIGQYVGLMYSVDRLNQAIEYLTKERDAAMAILLKPIALKDVRVNEAKKK